MKISPIVVANNYAKPINGKESASTPIREYRSVSELPALNKSYLMSFKGGYSLDLEQTMQNLEEAEIMGEKKIIPPLVREEAQNVLKEGNPDGLTLIDVHKKAYDDLKYAETLDEVKERYPEFEGVISSKDVNARQDSFLARVKEGKDDTFSADDDLALQLLKLYWADGFSLNDLSKRFDKNANFGYLMEKMNIPRLNAHYAAVLKLSDKEYNERMTEELSIKRAEKFEQKNGHAPIPRGPMSEEQKQKISISLMEYYAEHPEKAYMQSLRQREFYKNHPEAAETFRFVVRDAWKLGSSRPVKDSINQYFKRNNLAPLSEEELGNVQAMGAKRRLIMQQFWAQNPKAKDKFSTSMKCAWKRMKNAEEITKNTIMLPIPAYPSSIVCDMKEWAKEQGYNTNEMMFRITCSPGTEKALSHSKQSIIASEYFNSHPQSTDFYADTLCIMVANIVKKFSSKKDSTEAEKKVVEAVKGALKDKKIGSLDSLIKLYAAIIECLLNDNKSYSELDSFGAMMLDAEKEVIERRQQRQIILSIFQ